MKKAILLFIGIAVSAALFAQKSFLGTATFKIEVSGEGADLIKSMMPDTYQYFVGKNGMLFKMNGGIMQSVMGEILITPDGNSYIINHSDKTFSPMKNTAEAEEPKVKIEPQEEVLNILGYECKKYKVESETKGASVTQHLWVTDKYKIDVAPKGAMANNPGAAVLLEGINGLPLKIMANIQQMNLVITATELKEEKIAKTTFQIPKGYKEKEFDPMKMLGF